VRAARTITGVTLGPLLLPGKLTVIPAHADFAAFSPTYLAVFLVCALAVPLLIYLAGWPRARSVQVPVWGGGIVSFKLRMQYSAMTFSAPTRVTFDALYRPSVSVTRPPDDDPAGRSGPVHYEAQVTLVFQRSATRAISPCPLPSRSRISRTAFTARSRSLSGYFLCAAMRPYPSGLAVSRNSGAIQGGRSGAAKNAACFRPATR
jgi:hypothetical protein